MTKPPEIRDTDDNVIPASSAPISQEAMEVSRSDRRRLEVIGIAMARTDTPATKGAIAVAVSSSLAVVGLLHKYLARPAMISSMQTGPSQESQKPTENAMSTLQRVWTRGSRARWLHQAIDRTA